MTSPLLEVDQLKLSIREDTQILHGLSFSIARSEIVALIGESGCGKSLTALSLLGLHPPHFHMSGKICFEGTDLLESGFNKVRGNKIGLVLQDPNLALNPVITIGNQLIEGLRYHKKIPKDEAFQIGCEWLRRIGISDPKIRMKQYPHEFSGGMKQRIAIAMALICQPQLLIADEPTTALDVTVQAQLLDLLLKLQQEEGISLLLITHDLGVVARLCQRMLVMHQGQIIEEGTVQNLFSKPNHPYTQELLQSRKSICYPIES